MQEMLKAMIAPCGMNCTLCIAHQRDKNKCEGCNGNDSTKPAHCVNCSRKKCAKAQGPSGYCYDCSKFPCRRIKLLDDRYRANYQMSMIDNLNFIKQNGMEAFLERETERWTCKNCGEIICVHGGICLHCGTPLAGTADKNSLRNRPADSGNPRGAVSKGD